MIESEDHGMIGEVKIADLCERFGTPLYVYEEEVIRQRIQDLKTAIGAYLRTEFLYAVKTNFNPHLVRLIASLGFGVDAVSVEEVKLALRCGIPKEKIMYTESNMTDEEMRFCQESDVLLNVGSLSRLKKFGEAYPGSPLCVRFNPNVGAASHSTNITGGPTSKFGIPYQNVDQVLVLVKEHGLKLIGIHSHIGSGWLGLEEPLLAMDVVLDIARDIPDLKFIDLGGGFGVPYKPGQAPLDISTLGARFNEKFTAFCKEYGKELILRFEPGRYVVAEAGHLLTRVNTLKQNPEGRLFVGTDTGMNHLVRVAMYGSYHPILNVSNPSGPLKKYDVCGDICESADFFAKDRELPDVREGDILSIEMAGAYGMAMANHYQLRPLPAEVLISGGKAVEIRRRETFDDLLNCYSL